MNVGDLGREETRWPEDEIYSVRDLDSSRRSTTGSRPRRTTSTTLVDISCLEVPVAMLSGAISRAIREESLTRMTFRDPLTGLMHRRGSDEFVVLISGLDPAAVLHAADELCGRRT